MIYGNYSLEARIMEMGAEAFLCKPFKAVGLTGMVGDPGRADSKS